MNNLLENSGKKTLQPLPLRNNVVPKHIVLDIASVIDLFALEGKKKSELLKSVKESEHDAWSNLLNLQHKVFKCKRHQFHHQTQTDGVSLSLLLFRNDLRDEKWGSRPPAKVRHEFYSVEDLSSEQLDALKNRIIVGCDAAKHSLLYMMDSEGNKLQYTASQRKIESYGKRGERTLLQEKKRHDVIGKETRLSSKDSKSVDYEKFKEFLVEKDKLNKETTEFYKREV